MRRVLLIVFLGSTGLVLLGAVAAGIFLVTFNPNQYTRQVSGIVEKITGRQVVFTENVVTSFFPKPSLRTGRMVMKDPGIYGGDSFVTVEGASVVLAIEPLLHGILQVEEINLYSPTVQLTTTASGQHNWEYGFSDSRRKDETSTAINPLPGEAEVIALTDPSRSPAAAPGFFSRLNLQAGRLTCTDARVLYRDLRSGDFYTGNLDDFSVSRGNRDTQMPVALAGSLKDENRGRGLRFSLNATAGFDTAGLLAARVNALEVETQGIGSTPRRLTSRGMIRYAPAARTLEILDLQGSLDGATSFGGNLALTLTGAGRAAKITGEVNADALDLDALLTGLSPSAADSGAEEVKGAPNLSRPKVSAADRLSANSGTSGASEERLTGDAEKSGESVLESAGLDSDVTVTVTALTLKKLPVSRLSFSLRSANKTAEVPFSLDMFGGTATGTGRADFRTPVPSVKFAASARNIQMEELSRVMSDKIAVSGKLIADVDVTGTGCSWKEIAPTLKGKASAQVLQGEVRGFALIPANLRGVREAPVNFPFDRMSGSVRIERGIANSRDIALKSRLISAAGGGKINLFFEQLDLGIDFTIAGQPPVIPVNINGPLRSPFSSVDIRTLMRNTGEGVLTSPESARTQLKDAERLLQEN